MNLISYNEKKNVTKGKSFLPVVFPTRRPRSINLLITFLWSIKQKESRKKRNQFESQSTSIVEAFVFELWE